MSPNALLLLPWLAALGGWATVSVKDLPDYIVAGQATHLSFLVRQHGANRLNGLHPTIEARNGALAATVDAKSIGDGTYAGELTLTQPGDWTITINSGFGNSRVTLLPIRVVAAAGRMPVALTEVERGERLFTAKGCTTCHVQYDVGPKLAGRTFDPDYLGKWLADPQAVRANARMPRQDLTPADISALTAFLSQSAQRS
jgi:cytochrome c2